MKFAIRGVALAAMLWLSIPCVARSQTQAAGPPDAAKTVVAKQLVETLRVADQALQIMEQQLPAQRASSPGVPEKSWDMFLQTARSRRAELVDGYAQIYSRQFSIDEMRQLIAFFGTPIGKQFLDRQPAMMRDGMAMGQQWGMKLGGEVAQKLAAEMPKSAP
jgi:hypothetical protein